MLDGVLMARTTDEWMDIFAGAVPAAPLKSVGEALDSPFNVTRGRIVDLVLPGGQSIRMLATPIQCDPEAGPRRPAPELGADTDDLLRELGHAGRPDGGQRQNGGR